MPTEEIPSEATTTTTNGLADTGAGQAATPAPSSPEGAPAAAEQVPAYTPNYKFKSYGAEKEFDEFVRPIINEKTEKQIRELYEKAHGLDGLKPKYQKLQEDHNGLNGQFSTMSQNIDYLDGLVQEKDFGSFFDQLKIPKQEIFKWVMEEVKYAQADADTKAQLDRQRQQSRDLRETRHENNSWQSRYEQVAMENRFNQVDQELSKPDIAAVAQSFDQRMGEGAFRREVIRRGATYNMSGHDPAPAQLVTELVAMLSGQQAAVLPPAAAAAAPSALATTVAGKRDVPVIPNMRGGSAAPTQKKVKTVEDLRKLAQEME